jgi:hypothetical protein
MKSKQEQQEQSTECSKCTPQPSEKSTADEAVASVQDSPDYPAASRGLATADLDLLNLPAAERRRALAAKGQAIVDDWMQSDWYKKEQLKEEKQKERRERQAAQMINRKQSIQNAQSGNGGRPLTLGQRSYMRKLERLEAAKAAVKAVPEEKK